MKKFLTLIVLSTGLVFLALSAFGTPGKMRGIEDTGLRIQPWDINSIKTVKPDLNFGKLPLYFITNKGQVNQKAAFYAKTSRYTLWLTKEGLVFDRIKKVEAKAGGHTPPFGHPSQEGIIRRDVSRFIFLDARKDPEMVAVDPAKLRVNYFKGKDKSQWHCDVPTSMAVLYKNLYKGIDLNALRPVCPFLSPSREIPVDFPGISW